MLACYLQVTEHGGVYINLSRHVYIYNCRHIAAFILTSDGTGRRLY